MVLYAGETVRIKTTASDHNGTSLDDTTVDVATIEIVDSTATYVVNTSLVWEPTEQYFYYDWTTSTSGKFNARLRLIGTGATPLFDIWEYTKITLKTNKDGFVDPAPAVDINSAGVLTDKGDIMVHDGTNVLRLPVGADGLSLVADSAEASGVKWA